MATFANRKGRWFVQVRRKGFPAVSRTFSTKAAAKAWAVETESRIERGGWSGRHILKTVTLAAILERYCAEITNRKRGATSERLRIGKMLRRQLCQKPLSDLRSADFAEYRDDRAGEVAPATIVRELSLFHHALEIAKKEWGYPLADNPVALVSKPKIRNARTRRLQPGEMEALEKAMDTARNPLVRPIVHFAIQTGMRRGEILNMRWEDIDWDAGTLFIPQTKTGVPRTIPLTPPAQEILSDRKRQADASRFVFPVTIEAFKLSWRRVLRRAALTDLRFHDLRHEAVSTFFEMGLSMPEVAVISGHRDPRMLFRYTHLSAADLSLKLSKLACRREKPEGMQSGQSYASHR